MGLVIEFIPEGFGKRTATLEIASNDPDTPTLSIQLTGFGNLMGNVISDRQIDLIDIDYLFDFYLGKFEGFAPYSASSDEFHPEAADANRDKEITLAYAQYIYDLVNWSSAPNRNWVALPHYNVLWPLWLPTLSPVVPTTALPTPLVTFLTRSTTLPIEPAMVWDPYMEYPYLLYNSPHGLQYYDIRWGKDIWPPPYLLAHSTYLPLPISLPYNYGSLPITNPYWMQINLPQLNKYLYESMGWETDGKDLMELTSTTPDGIDMYSEPTRITGNIGSKVVFTLMVAGDATGKRADVRCMGMAIQFNNEVLGYKGYIRKGLGSKFAYFDINDAGDGRIRLGAFQREGTICHDPVITAVDEGKLATLLFEVKGEGRSLLTIVRKDDDISAWNMGYGEFSFSSNDIVNALPTEVLETFWGQASLTFDTIHEQGTSTVEIVQQAPRLQPYYKTGDTANPYFYDLQSTTKYDGPIKVCFEYIEDDFEQKQTLRLLHYEYLRWIDITASLDTEADMICGLVNEPGLFVIVEPRVPCLFKDRISVTGVELYNHVNTSEVLIGMEEKAFTTSFSLPLKDYTVLMKIMDLSNETIKYYSEEIKEESHETKNLLLQIEIPSEIKREYPDPYYPLLAWDSSGFCSVGVFQLWSSNGYGELLSFLVADMTKTSNYRMKEADGEYFCIAWLPNTDDISITMELNTGWNMISLPVQAYNTSIDDLFTEAEAVFGYNDSYVPLDMDEYLRFGHGYWIYLSLPKTYSITGWTKERYAIRDAIAGWSMIGSCSYPCRPRVDIGSIRAVFGYQGNTNGYKFLGSYYDIDPLEPGKGYWVFLSADADLMVEKVNQINRKIRSDDIRIDLIPPPPPPLPSLPDEKVSVEETNETIEGVSDKTELAKEDNSGKPLFNDLSSSFLMPQVSHTHLFGIWSLLGLPSIKNTSYTLPLFGYPGITSIGMPLFGASSYTLPLYDPLWGATPIIPPYSTLSFYMGPEHGPWFLGLLIMYFNNIPLCNFYGKWYMESIKILKL